MAQFPSDPNFFSTSEAIDISGAKYIDSLSHLVLDNQSYFEATVDRLVFKSLLEIARGALEANGFAANLENLLFALDHSRIGVRSSEILREGQRVSAKSILPSMQILLPAKGEPGELLKAFYSEIAGYEEALAKAQGQLLKQTTTDDSTKSKDDLIREINILRERNRDLLSRIETLSTKLAQLQGSLRDHAETIRDRELLPAGIRNGQVLRLDFDRRIVAVKTDAGQVSVPMADLSALPSPSSNCLVHVDQGVFKRAFFYEGELRSYESRLAEILFIQGETIKVRDDLRNEMIFQALSPTEKETLQRLTRGTKLLLLMHENKICAFRTVSRVRSEIFGERVQEAIAVQQIRDHLFSSQYQADE